MSGKIEPGAGSPDNPVGGKHGLRDGCHGRFGSEPDRGDRTGMTAL